MSTYYPPQESNTNRVCCPKCGGTNINYQREQSGNVGAFTNTVYVKEPQKRRGCLYWVCCLWLFELLYWLFIGWWWNLLFGRKRHGGVGFNANKAFNHTVAVCQNCGYSWNASGLNTPPTSSGGAVKTIGVIAVALIAVAVIVAVLGNLGHSGANPTSPENTPVTGNETNTRPADIEDFTYELSGDTVLLTKYTGRDKVLTVRAAYEIDGRSYTTDLSDFQIGSSRVKTLILDEGITTVKTSIFNSSDVERIFFPKSMSTVYDYTLSYLHPANGERIEIYYAGTQEEWQEIFTEYERTPVEDAEFGEELGEALADKLNEALGASYDSAQFVYYFSATPEEIPSD